LFWLAACGGSEADVPIAPPEAITDSAPFVYPIELWDEKISGETLVLMRISALGAVDSVVVAKSSGYREFDSAAVQGARAMKFTAGRQGERRVAMWTKLPVRFARDTANRMGLGQDTNE
jgi:TonB family protein